MQYFLLNMFLAIVRAETLLRRTAIFLRSHLLKILLPRHKCRLNITNEDVVEFNENKAFSRPTTIPSSREQSYRGREWETLPFLGSCATLKYVFNLFAVGFPEYVELARAPGDRKRYWIWTVCSGENEKYNAPSEEKFFTLDTFVRSAKNRFKKYRWTGWKSF